jgi:hypothetical protein
MILKYFSLPIILFLILSCAAPIRDIPESMTVDIKNEIIFLKSFSNIFDQFTGNEISSMNLNNKNASSIYSGSFISELLSKQELLPFISPSGKYAVCNNRFKFTGRLSLSIYDLQSGENVGKLTADRPEKTFQAEPYIMNWAAAEDIFYFFRSDSIYQFEPMNHPEFLAHIPDLHSFAVAPNEESILACYQDSIGIYDLNTNRCKSIYSMKKILGMTKHAETRLCWSPNSQNICFSDGREINVFQPALKNLIKYKSLKDIFYLTMINDNNLIYVCGSYPSDGSQYQTTEEFSIVKLDIQSGSQTILHSRYNHEPFSIQPKPNGSVLLFSEKKLNGGYQVKLMTDDGQYMSAVCGGIYPSWQVKE